MNESVAPAGAPAGSAGAAGADPVAVEVIRHGLVAAAEQMATAIERSARSQVIREVLDYSTAVFDLDGGIVAQSTRIPIHLNSMTRALRELLDGGVGLSGWRPGDVFATNDPYHGGQHLPDIMGFSLVEVAGEPVALCGALAHHLDVGGRAPGSYGADATDVFQEGLRIPPCRVQRDGVIDPLFLELLAANVRVPDQTTADLRAQLASLDVGAAEVRRVVQRYGAGAFRAALRELADHAERRMRDAIARVDDGVYRAEDWVDGDGLDDEPVPIRVAVRVEGDRLVVDLTGCAAQVRGPINCPLAATESAVYYAVIAMLDPGAAANHGCYRPVELLAPAGSVVNPAWPAAVVGRNVVAHRVAQVVMSALGDALPERAVAAYYGNSNIYILSFRQRDGGTDVLFEIEVGGWGAARDRDGHDCLSAGTHNLMNTPVELVEQEHALRVERYELRCDSGGAGARRGGMGVRRVMTALDDGELSTQFDRIRFPPPGRDGGRAGAPGRVAVIRDGEERELPGKVLAQPLRRGDRVVIDTQGGGGFGDPAERERELVLRDVAEGRVSAEAARRDHGLDAPGEA